MGVIEIIGINSNFIYFNNSMPKIVKIFLIIIFLVIISLIIYIVVDNLSIKYMQLKYLGEFTNENSLKSQGYARFIADKVSLEDAEHEFGIKLPRVDFDKNEYLYLSLDRKVLNISYNTFLEKDYNAYTSKIILLDNEYNAGKIYVYMLNKMIGGEGTNTILKVKDYGFLP